jgi:Ser/Thr protein kinase RdoA (MazF antagonist)
MRKIGEGREAEILEWDASHVLRLMRDPHAASRLARERSALVAAREGGAPAPAVGDLVTIDGRPGLVMERVRGNDLISDVARRPWTIVAASGALGRAHAAVHAIRAPATLVETRAMVSDRIKDADLPPACASVASRALDALADGDRLCHGDFHPGNVLVSGNHVTVIDWTNASRGAADADVARTLLMLELAVVPETMPAIVRTMSAVGRRIFHRGYIHAYRAIRPFDDAAVHRWKIAHAGARVAEGIVEERDVLIRFLQRHTG